jgi:hypothetical protein
VSGKGSKNRRKRTTSGYRAPEKQPAKQPATQQRRGLLDSIFAPRTPGSTSMPNLRKSFARGFVLVISTPVLVILVPTVLIVLWSLAVAFGFQGPFTQFGATFAIPPVGTVEYVSIGSIVFSASGFAALGAIVALLLVRGVLLGLVATVAVERLRTGSVSRWALLRLVRVVPVAFLVNAVNLALLILGNQLAALLGPGIGLLVYFGVLVGGLYFTAFATTIAADEDRGIVETLRRSFRAARMPGSQNLTLAVLYTIPGYAALVAPLPGSKIGVNPSASAWVASIIIGLLNVAVAATFSFRYLSAAAEIPELPPLGTRR